tara:strand:- start:245 stop:1135 length:891 start_codon:yes stop_codon:yes gene_type:complete
MKGMRIVRKQAGGYMSALQQTRPDLYKTISNYRGRLTAPEQQTFDKRANIQYKASMNMPDQMRQAYYKSIEQQYSNPTDAQFQQVREGLKSRTFVPTYRYVDPSTQGPARTTGYYRDMSKEISQAEKDLSGLTLTESRQKTVPLYSYYEGRSGVQGLAGSRPGVARTTTELPEGSIFRPASGGGIGARSADYISPSGVRYVQQGTKKITETTTRPQRAGDAEYDKLAASLSRLQTRHKYRFAPQYSQDGGTGLTSENIYQKLGMAKDGGLKEDLKNKKFSNGGKASIRGTKFTGVF